jgi:putative membrane protein
VSDPTPIKPGILPSGAAAPLPGAALDYPPPVPMDQALPGTALPMRRGFRWGVALGLSLVGFLAALVVVDSSLWVVDLFARSAVLGAAAAALLFAVLASAVGLTVGETRALMRLKEAGRIREEGHRLLASSGGFEAHPHLNDLMRLISGHATGRMLCERYRDAVSDAHDDREALQLFERMVLRPLDEQALGAIRRAARDAAVGTSVSPVAGIDAAIVIWRSLRLVREIGEIYGLRPSRLGVLSLIRRMLVTATFSVTADMVGDVVGAHLGGRLAGLISGKLAEGVYAGVRTARLGLFTMEQCRPLPFADGGRPNLRQLLSQSFAALLPEAEPRRIEKESKATDEHG